MLSEEEKECQVNQLVKKWESGFRRGSLRFFILHLLLHQERLQTEKVKSFHGYHLAQIIDEITRGKWKPKTASIYPILNELCEKKVIEPIKEQNAEEGGRSVKKYQLTGFGKQIAEKVEESRKEFSSSFAYFKAKTFQLPFSKLRHELSDEEMEKILDNTDLESLKNHQTRLASKIGDLQDTLDFVDIYINKRENKET
jgi:DNA-binding PadR family transcriptional regulator